jgi:hypothetical protein
MKDESTKQKAVGRKQKAEGREPMTTGIRPLLCAFGLPCAYCRLSTVDVRELHVS